MASMVFITGCSASGKTTLFEDLKQDPELSNYIFHDIDESGVPPVGRDPWREYRVEQLLFDATALAKEGKGTVVCGITFVHEVLESVYLDPAVPVHFIALGAPERSVRSRILERVRQNEASKTFDESFNNDNAEISIFENIRNQKIIINSVSALKNGHLIETDKHDAQSMTAIAKDIIIKL